ncbi:methylated-DNA--[protein]-cysteine S-methyltransferase [Candidatus Calescamantes bacterium]|nr:methylated-DNA--[protein]-cysteine S-methyltransferase [Candidatus Calescamantes bacterium]
MEKIIFYSSIGYLLLQITKRGVYAVKKLAKGETTGFHPVAEMIKRYLEGEKMDFAKIPIDWSGYSPLQKKVLEKVREVPYGEWRSYSWVAKEIGLNYGWRYIGKVLSINRTPIIIPCHRIIYKNKNLGGFTWGKETKKFLLELEGISL